MEKLNPQGIENILSLTPLQEGMLFHYLQDPKGRLYYEQLCLEISGTIEIQTFEGAWHTVIQSNEMLRTMFRWEKVDNPVQLVQKEYKFQPRYIDLTGLRTGEYGMWKEKLDEIKHNDTLEKFDLQEVPFRVTLCTIDVDKHVMIIGNHHILYDGWSNGIILREFFKAYHELLRNTGSLTFPAIPIKPSFKEFLKWLHNQDKGRQKEFWQDYFAGFETPTELPIKKGAETETTGGVGDYSIILEDFLKDNLEVFVKDNRVTLASVFYTAWGILLQKYCDRQDVVFGTTVSGRSAAIKGIEDMVGLFINTAPLRFYTSAYDKIGDIVFQTDHVLREREAFENTSLVDIVNYSLVTGGASLFDAIIAVENYPLDKRLVPEDSSLVVNSYSMNETTHYDLSIGIMPFDKIEIKFSFQQGFFEKETIANLARHFKGIIENILKNPGLELCRLEILSKAEKDLLLYQFNNTAAEYPRDKMIPQLFEEQAAKRPDRVGLVGPFGHVRPVGPGTITYRQLNEQSGHLAGLLIEKGVQPDDIIGIMMNRSVEMIIAIMGILKSGGAYLPIDPEYPQERIDYMLKESNALFLINEKFFRGSRGAVFQKSPPVIVNLAYVIYTSGSTGKPKGVMIEHRSVINFIKGITDVIPFRECDRVLSLTTICFDIFGLETILPLTKGSMVVIGDEDAQRDVYLAARMIEHEAITIFQATPSRMQLFIQDKTAGKALMKLKYLIIGGEALPGPLLESLKQQTAARIFNVYGPTETTIWSTIKEVSADLPLNIGKPLANTCIYILNRSGLLQPVHVPGECCIGGDGVARGYLNNPELTRGSFKKLPLDPAKLLFNHHSPLTTHHSPIYYTGDLARWLPDGNLEFLGRIDKQVKIRGFRIELGEIEAQLLKHNHVKAAVTAVTNGDTLNAYIVLKNEELKKTPDASQFKEFLSQYLPGYMIPSHFFLLDKIPLTPNGKIDTKALQAANRVLSSGVEYISPQSDIERTIANVWKELLNLEKVGIHDNFFDLGGNSLAIIRLNSRLKEALPGKKDISVVTLFNHPTIASLANYLNREEPKTSKTQSNLKISEAAIAVIGMAGRFPGAKNIDEFWENIKNGVESIRFFTKEELKQLGVADELINNPDYVPAKGVLENKEYFDSFFFGYTPSETEILDPQIRIFHECTWAALENAGYDPFNYDGAVGLYAGAGQNPLWEILPLTSGAIDSSYSEMWNALQFSDKDYLSTRIAYKLDLKGPCVTIQTACSTSLVAVDQACRSLVSGACTMAMAGGISLTFQDDAGYLYQEGAIMSPDGHCRAFDAQAKGTVGGNGAGVVVLKRLADAQADGDTIYAVIKGFGINNDGKNKAGFTAPSSIGQSKAIRGALDMAEINPETIGYIETHGTGTPLGDPIEIEGLKLAFNSPKKHFCAIGSIKTNIGHLDVAAGIAGFIKATLSLYHRLIPPSLNFKTPNPQCNLENSPFYVNTELKPCENHPFRAGISSFGLGGTNVHIILEEYQKFLEVQKPFYKKVSGRQGQMVILLSAKTPAALETMSQNLVNYFEHHPNINLPDAAYTLQVGRKAFNYRRMLVCSDLNEVIAKLPDAETALAKEEKHSIIFMFSGQGSQYVNMGLDLYQNVPVFQHHIDECFTILEKITGIDMKSILYPNESNEVQFKEAEEKIFQFKYTTPIKFSFEYSLAKTLMAWGITPNAMIGHSFGEYVAACLSGVFSLEDGLFLAALRGELMHGLPGGAMLSVPLSEKELKQRLTNEKELDIAAINAESLCIISGPIEAVNRFEAELNQEGHECLRLQVPKAGHSRMVEPIMAQFKQKIGKVKFNKPQIPFISCVSGTWIKAEEAVNPDYWTQHLRKPVRFADGLTYLFKEPNPIFLQTTPGKGLILFINQHPDHNENTLTLSMVRHHKEPGSDVHHTFTQIGRLWLHGCDKINWQALYEEKRQRIPLPSYPFEPTHFPINKELFKPGAPSIPASFSKSRKKTDKAEWFYIPSWERSTLPPSLSTNLSTSQKQTVLVFSDERIGPQLIQQLEQNGANVITVQMGALNPAAKESYDELWQRLETQGQIPSQIYHLWSISQEHSDKTLQVNINNINENLTHGFYSLLYLVQAITKQNIPKEREICLNILTANACEVSGNEELNPASSSIHALSRVIRQEYPDLTCRCIDITFPIPSIEILLEEFSANSQESTVAYRSDYRWVESFKPLRLEKPRSENLPLREKGVYLITGGLGAIGMTLAEYLATTFHARLILTGRSHLSLEKNPGRKKRILAMEAAGAEILLLKADAADRQQMQAVFLQAEEKFGQINGIIHAAGNVGEKFLCQLKDMGKPEVQLHFEPKIYGLIVLAELLKDKPMDFCLLMSSTSAILGGLGFGAYAAANRFMDIYTYLVNKHSQTRWLSVNWDSWRLEKQEVGESALGAEINELAITPSEGVDIFARILGWPRAKQVIGCLGELQPRIDRWVKLQDLHPPAREGEPGTIIKEKPTLSSRRPRPHLSTPYLPPQNDRENEIAEIWAELLGCQPIGLQDNFFELNGDSLKAVIATAKIHKQTNVKVPLKDFFINPTIAGVIQYIDQAKGMTFQALEPVEKKEYYPLSSAQKRLYIYQQLQPDSTAYNMPTVYRLTGHIDLEKFHGIFGKMIQRHEALRTTFLTINGEMAQVIAERSDFNMTYWELNETEALARIPDLVKPFDLSRAPLLRVVLIKVREQHYIIFVDIHHIISDRGSMEIIIDNITRFYQGENIKPLAVQYKDYATRLAKKLHDEKLQAQEKYWLSRLQGLTYTRFPGDYLKPQEIVKGGARDQEIAADFYQKIDRFCTQHNVTKFIFLLTAFQITLARKLEQWDITLGIPSAIRDHPDLKEIIGIFLNILLIRTTIDYNESFLNLLTRNKSIIIEALDNQDYPYEMLIDKIKTDSPAKNELFSILFNYFPMDLDQKRTFPGFQIKPLDFSDISPKYDITIYARDGSDGDRMILSFVYKSNIYSEDIIKKLSADFLATLQKALENEKMSIVQLTNWNHCDNNDSDDGSDIDQYYN